MISITGIISAGFERLLIVWDHVRGWAELHLRMSRGMASIMAATVLPGMFAAAASYRWAVGQLTDASGFVDAAVLPYGLADVSAAAAAVGGGWLARANTVFPVAEFASIAVALLAWAGVCASIKFALYAGREVL